MDDFGLTLTPLLIAGLFWGGVGAIGGFLMLDRVDKGSQGALIGFLLGPIGWAIAWVMRDNALRDQDAYDRRHKRGKHAPAEQPVGFSRRAPAPGSPIEALERLARLRDQGHLTEEEYLEQKAVLLRSTQATGRKPPFRGFDR